MLQSGATLGKYRIERKLGQGGVGMVFLAYDADLQRQLAIKVLRSPDEDKSSRAQLLREARSASALNHPSICTVYEVGEADGCAFIAMEYVEGRLLCDLIDADALSVADAVHYGIATSDALAHAHDRGVVHRDLKAANAIVSSNGHLKIVDFGLARRVQVPAPDGPTQTMLTHEGVVAGTPYAMAPEQVVGGRSDPRTDIWALGVLLYEMLSGVRPFRGSTSAELFAGIVSSPPAPMPVETPDALRTLVLRCLAKDPTERYQRAADVRLMLEAADSLLQRSGPLKSEPSIATGAPLPPPPMLQATSGSANFVGRENELALMAGVWTKAREGQPQLMLVAGEPGIGKTWLALEFARRQVAEGATVLVGRSDEEALVPYQPFVEALNWYARVCPESELRAQLAAIGGGAEVGQLIPELMRRGLDLPAPTAMNPDGQRYRLSETTSALLAAASEARPMILIFDDLHWADRPTLLLLRHLVRKSEAAHLCIVGTYRESELDRAHPLAEMLADLRRERVVTRFSLRGLSEPQTRALVDVLVGPDLPSQLARQVLDSTDGNPFFIVEMLRHLSETGALTQLRETSGFNATHLGLPEGVKEVIGRRLSRLSEECNRALSLAAVVGREFDLDVLLALGDLREDQLLDALDDAMSARLISEAPDRSQRFSFMHALIRETLYGELTSARRVRLHRRVGEAIERLTDGQPTPPLADLAFHFAQAAPAGAADKAIDYATRAGDRAADALALEEAARLYDMGLQSLEFKTPGPEANTRRVDLHTRRARAFGALGQWEPQKHEVEEALRHLDAKQIDRRAELCLELAEASMFLLDTPSMERSAREALELAEELHRPDLASDATGWLARGAQADGDLGRAIELDRAARALGSGVWHVTHAIGPLSLYLIGQTEEAVALGAEAAKLARSSRNTAYVMQSLTHFAMSLAGNGRYDEARKVFDEARQFGRKYGVLPYLARATCISGGLHLSVCDYEGAEAIQTEARELALSVGFVPTVVSASIDLLLILARTHKPGGAEGFLRETAEAAANAAGWHGWLWALRLHQTRAELALARGDLKDAADEARAGSLQSRAKRRPKYEALGLITAAQALQRLGHTHEAIADARRAVAVARGTGDPALLLQALGTLLNLDGDDQLATEARTVGDRIAVALPDETMRRRFADSDVMQRIRRL